MVCLEITLPMLSSDTDRVDKTKQIMSTTEGGRTGKRRRGQQQAEQEPQETEQRLSSVLCAVCGVLVGAQDADEVYHFYHVVASTA